MTHSRSLLPLGSNFAGGGDVRTIRPQLCVSRQDAMSTWWPYRSTENLASGQVQGQRHVVRHLKRHDEANSAMPVILRHLGPVLSCLQNNVWPRRMKKYISKWTLIINPPGQPLLWLRCLNNIKSPSPSSYFPSVFARSKDTHDDLFHKVTHCRRAGQVRSGQVNTYYYSHISA